MLKKIGRKIKGNFMGPINQPEVKMDDNKKNNEIIEKKKGGICFRIQMCFIYLFMKCFGSGKYEKKKKK